MHTQLVVLGGGPGGYAAAFLAADEGLEEAILGLFVLADTEGCRAEVGDYGAVVGVC